MHNVMQRIFLVLSLSFMLLAINIVLIVQGGADKMYVPLCGQFPAMPHCRIQATDTTPAILLSRYQQ